jgi:CBS domain-containing protein
MDDIFVGQLMTSPVVTTTPDTPIYQSAQTMLQQDIGSLIIVDGDGHLEGILTSTDFVQLVADRQSIDGVVVEEYMTTVDAAMTADRPIREAADEMMDSSVHHLPVVDGDGRVTGILTTTDLTAYLSADWTPSPS